MPRSPRRIVRSAVGLAAIAPAVGLLVLAAALMMSGGFSGVLAGAVVTVIAVALLGAALLMTHAPVSIRNLLERTAKKRDDRSLDAGSNGHGSAQDVQAESDEGDELV